VQAAVPNRFLVIREPFAEPEAKQLFARSLITMKGLSIIITAFILVFGTIGSRAATVDRVSTATGVSVATLQAERASTGLGWGSLEKAHLLANASGQSFNNVVTMHQSGQGWGRIARNNGLNLGKLVSNANRSSNATMHAKNTKTMHAMNGMHAGKGHGAKTSMTGGFNGSHGMHSMGHMSASHGMGSMGHGGRGR